MLSQTNPDRAWIACHVPHQGRMCLLDHVESWDEQHIQCCASSHRATDNPLRAYDRLGAACGIEYAAQAMAVHGALLVPSDGPGVRIGYLVSMRSTMLHVPRLDDIAADLLVHAACVTRGGNNLLYQFRVSAAGRPLVEGRAAIVLNSGALVPTVGRTP